MIKNLEASIKARLQNISKENGLTLDYVVLRYMQEKLLKRLSISAYKENFVLKGGLFFLLFDNLNPRVTKDIDFLGNNIDNSKEFVEKVFKEILVLKIEDGLIYDLDNIEVERIKEDADYEGIRLKIECYLGKMSKKIQIDIGYGDKVYPHIQYAKYPSLLDDEIDNIAAYSIETVISEKFEAMLKLSYLNSRLKDFYDIYNIINSYDIIGENIQTAINETLQNRGTLLEKNPVIFREDFYTDKEKLTQWKYFIKKINIENIDFEEVINNLKIFLGYIIENLLKNKRLEKNWNHLKQIWE